jgi:hypothetical protein
MRKLLASLIAASAAFAGVPAVQACDMEGFGFARVNPFGQYAARNVPKDTPNPQQSENPAVISASAREESNRSVAQDAARVTNADQPSSNSEVKAFAVSQTTPADQAKRFTATKD